MSRLNVVRGCWITLVICGFSAGLQACSIRPEEGFGLHLRFDLRMDRGDVADPDPLRRGLAAGQDRGVDFVVGELGLFPDPPHGFANDGLPGATEGP